MKKDRLYKLTVLAGALLCLALLLTLLLGAAYPPCLSAAADIYLAEGWARAAVIVVSALLMALTAVRTWRALFPKADQSAKTLGLKSVEGGSVQVSVTALETMARHAVGDMPGVKDADVFLTEAEDGLNVKIDLRVGTNVRVPELTGGMQTRVKEAVESFTGMTIKDVTVLVSDIVEDGSNRQ